MEIHEVNDGVSPLTPSAMSKLHDGIKLSNEILAKRFSFKGERKTSIQRKISENHREIVIGYNWPMEHWELLRTPHHRDIHSVSNGPLIWEVDLDLSMFKPEDIRAVIVNNELLITGKHELRSDELGSLEREFRRVIRIPGDVEVASLTSYMHPNGLLSIRANKKGDQYQI